VLLGHCVAYGEGATFLPLAEMVAGIGADPATVLAGEDDRELVAGRIAELLGRAEGSAGSGEGFWAVRRLLGGLARQRPVVAVFEDVQWAEPTLLDLIEYLAGFSSGAPILLLCLARPEFLEARPQWILAAPDAVSLRLEPLRDEQAQALIESLNGDVAPAVHDRIAEIAEGNPLFVEQLLAYTREAGADALDAVPPSLEALLASRLDLLAPEERTILQCAAVVGREFWRGAVVDLAPAELVPTLSSQLLALVRRGLVRPARSAFALDDAFRFDHPLIRLVAYTGIPKALRAELHERHADWLAEQPVGTDELVGYHLEQAYRYGTELGPVDRRLQRLAADAGERLGAAGIRAWKRGDTPATVNLLGRATRLLPEQDSYRLELMCELGIALATAAELTRAEETLEDAHAVAAASGQRHVELRARVDTAIVRLSSDPEFDVDEVSDVASEAIEVFEELPDERALARTWLMNSLAQGIRCRFRAAGDAARRALEHYRRSGWSSQTSLGLVAISLFYGPTPVAEALDACTALLDQADLGGEAHVLAWMAGLEAMRRRFGDARDLVDRAKRRHQQLGQLWGAQIDCAEVAGEIEMLAEDFTSAERELRASCRLLEQMNDRNHLSRRAGQLASALYARGQFEEARRWADRSHELAPTGDLFNQCSLRSIQAKLLARNGDLATAEALARGAAAMAEESDSPNLKANSLLDLGEVLGLGGRPAEAASAVDQAFRHFEEKGNVASANRARSLLAELGPS
jgi:tetratricopeptide (TPR) repeat protein